MQPLIIYDDLNPKPYKEVLAFQEKLFNQKIEHKKNNQRTADYLILCQHQAVYTFGKSANHANLLITEELLKNINATKIQTNRGGDITFHGPGQLVVYPIIDLENHQLGVRKYVELLEESIIQTLAHFGIQSFRIPSLTGVWLDSKDKNQKKIAAIGIKCSRGITMHGAAININTDLSYFNHMIPCGIKDKGVTSLQNELNKTINFHRFTEVYKTVFRQVFEFNLA